MNTPPTRKRGKTFTDLFRDQYVYIKSIRNPLRRSLLFTAYGLPLFALMTSPVVVLAWLAGFHFNFQLVNHIIGLMEHKFNFISESSHTSQWPRLNAIVFSYDLALNLIAAAAFLVENVIFSILIDFPESRRRIIEYAHRRVVRRGYLKSLIAIFSVFAILTYAFFLDLTGKGLLTDHGAYTNEAHGLTLASLLLVPAQSNLLIMLVASYQISIFPVLYITMTWRSGLMFFYILTGAA